MNIKEALQMPFPIEDISWKVQTSGRSKNGKIWAIVVPYVKASAIQERLDSILGPENWKNEPFQPGPAGGLQCGLSLWINGNWVTKWDGADNTNYEPIKGGMTDAFKRAARMWGIGRYLTKVKPAFAEVFENSKNGEFTDYIKEGDKKLYFSWNPPGLPDFCFPKKKQLTNDEWKHAVDKFREDTQDIINTPDETKSENPEVKKMKNHIAEMISELKKWKRRTDGGKAAYLEISKKCLKADNNLQKLREIEAEASRLLHGELEEDAC
jgi:hypothetical protein